MKPIRHAEAVMGTVVSFEVRHALAALAHAAINEALAWLHWVDATFSTYKPNSEIARVERGTLSLAACHPEVRFILDQCDRLRTITGGYFDARASGHLDPSGVVKGWSIERASQLLTDAGCPDHYVDGGGDVRLHGCAGPGSDWRVALTHPMRTDAYCAVVHLDEGAVATSGTYQRGFHVLDPHQRRPAMDLAAVTVIGPELMTTDAFATAALAMGHAAPAWLATLTGHEAIVIDADGRSWETKNFSRYRLGTERRAGGQAPNPGSSSR